MSSSSGIIVWSYEEEKAFENAIAMHWIEEDSEEKWEKIASSVPSKSMEELKQHYQILIEDVSAIEAGHIPLPNYTGGGGEEAATSSTKELHASSKASTSDNNKRSNCNYRSGFSGLGGHDSSSKGGSGSSRSSEQERRKGIPWTEEEHRYFILSLQLLDLIRIQDCYNQTTQLGSLSPESSDLSILDILKLQLNIAYFN